MPTTGPLPYEISDDEMIDAELAAIDPQGPQAERVRNRAINLAAQQLQGRRVPAETLGTMIDFNRQRLLQPTTVQTQQASDIAIARQEGAQAGLVENALRPFQRSRLAMSQALMTGYNEEDMTAAQRAGEILAAESQASSGPGEFVGGMTQMLPMLASAGTLAAPSLVGRVIPGLARAPGLVAGLGEGLATAPMAAEGIAAANEAGASIPAALGAGTAEAIGYSLVPRVVPKILPSAAPSMAQTVGRQMADFLKAAPQEALQTGVGMGGAQAVAETGKAGVGLADPGVAEMMEQQGGLGGAVERIGMAGLQGAALGPAIRALQLPGQIRDAQDAQFNRQMADVAARADKDMADLAAVDAARAKQAAAEQDVADRQAAFEDIVQRSEPAYAASLEAQRQDLAARGRLKRQQAAAKREAEMAAAEANRVRMEREMPPIPEAEVAARREQAAELVPRPPPARVEPMGPEMPPVAGARPAPEPAHPEAPAPTPSPEAPASPMRPERAPAETAPAAEQAPVAEAVRPVSAERRQTLQRHYEAVKKYVERDLKGGLKVEMRDDYVAVRTPNKEVHIRVPEDLGDVVTVMMNPRNAKSTLESLVSSGEPVEISTGQGKGRVATLSAGDVDAWLGMPVAKRKQMVERFVYGGGHAKQAAMTIVAPHSKEGIPFPAAAHIYALSGDLPQHIIGHELEGHVNLPLFAEDAWVARVRDAMVNEGVIQSTNPKGKGYVEPSRLSDLKALRTTAAFEEAFAYAYGDFIKKAIAKQGAKDLIGGTEPWVTRVGAKVGDVFAKLWRMFRNLLPLRKDIPKEKLDDLMKMRFEGPALQGDTIRNQPAGRTDQIADIEAARAKKEQYAQAAESERNIRREEAEMGRQREADLAEPKMDAAARELEIAKDIDRLTREVNRAENDGRVGDAARDRRTIRELKTELGVVRASLKETKTKAEAEDARAIVEPPPEEGVRPAFEQNRAIQAQTPEARKREQALNEEATGPESTMDEVRGESNSLLANYRRRARSVDEAYNNFIDDMIEGAKGDASPSLSSKQVEATLDVLSYWSNRMAGNIAASEKAKATKAFDKVVAMKILYGSEAGRILSMFHDRVETPAQRVAAIRLSMATPPPHVRKRISAMHKAGNAAEARAAAIERAQKAMANARDEYKKTYGIDIEEILKREDLFDGEDGVRNAFEVSMRIADIVDPASRWQIAKSYYQNALLTASGMGGLNNVANGAFGAIQFARMAATKHPRQTLAMAKAMAASIPQAINNALWAGAKGYSKIEAEGIGSMRRSAGRDSPTAWRDPLVRPGKGAFAKTAAVLSLYGAPRRLGLIGDEVASTIWFHGALAAHADELAVAAGHARGSDAYEGFVKDAMQNPTREMKEAAGDLAAKMTFRTEQTGWLATVNKLRNDDSAKGFATTLIMPYFNTLVNLTKAGWEMSPIGGTFASGADLLRYFAYKYHGGEKDPTLEKVKGREIAEQIIGRGLAMAMMYYGSEGVGGTAASYRGEAAEAERERRSGTGESLLAGDVEIPLAPLQPFALPLLQSADLRKWRQGKMTWDEFFTKQYKNSIGEQYAGQLLEWLAAADRGGVRKLATDTASGFLPMRGFVRDADRLISGDEVKETKSRPSESVADPDSWSGVMRDILRAGWPMAGEAVYDKRESAHDVFGDTQQRPFLLRKREAEDRRRWNAWIANADDALERAKREAKDKGDKATLKSLKGITEPMSKRGIVDGEQMPEEQFAEAEALAGRAFLKWLNETYSPETMPATPQALKHVSKQYGKLWERAVKQVTRGLPGRMVE